MRTRVIAAFPGVGKSFYHKLHPDTTIDSDSSLFSWIEVDGQKVRNPEFPNNYITHIKENIGKYKIIFVSSHKEVREALLDNSIFFYLLYPNRNAKERYVKRYKDRGSPESFIKLVSDNWLQWISECDECDYGCSQIVMFDDIEKEIQKIVRSEREEL